MGVSKAGHLGVCVHAGLQGFQVPLLLARVRHMEEHVDRLAWRRRSFNHCLAPETDALVIAQRVYGASARIHMKEQESPQNGFCSPGRTMALMAINSIGLASFARLGSSSCTCAKH